MSDSVNNSKEQKQALVKKTKAEKKALAAQKKAEKANADLFVSPAVNALLWVVAIVLIAGAIFGNYYYTNFVVIDESTLGRLGRVFAVIGVIVVAAVVLLFTNKGHALLDFSHKSYVELKKVVWPTRQEAVQTTLIVFVAVCVVSLFLYLCDVVFLQIIESITM
ncbi:MAG: preprotein translocase subunit SecE [Succinivibrio sp.]|nr:preprotein translocase subunit SecE [Succinivibrio sp.]